MIVVVDNTVTKRRFITKLLAYLKSKNVSFQVVRTLVQFQNLPTANITGIILSGSTKNVHQLAEKDYLLNAAAASHGAPILGICFGSQFLHTYHGGALFDLGSIHCQDFKVERKMRVNSPLFENLPKDFAARFCNQFGYSNVATKCKILATYKVDGQTMPCAFQHRSKPVYGVLFHPENYVHTHVVLDNFIATTKTSL